MDPLSITASVVALATAAAQISTAISRLRHVAELPGKIYALKNEISDLELVLRQIGDALEQKLLTANNAQGSLEQVLAHTKGHLARITKALERLANACTGSKIKVIGKSTVWLREKAVFQTFRDDISSVKASLNLMLGAANSRHLQDIVVELQKVTVLTTKSEQTNESVNQGLKDNSLQLTTRLDQQHEILRERIEALGNLFLSRDVQGSETRTRDLRQTDLEKGIDSQTLRVVTSYRRPCRGWCPCSCHRRGKLKLTPPKIVEGVLGRMFVGYSGLPLLKEPCDFRGCQDRQNASATFEYWFPAWFVSMNLKMHLTYLPMTGPELQLSTTRRVADDSLSITFAMQGNIEALKHLFIQGLASPRDVSDSRGYTLMRWALYGGMHNWKTVRFLINQGAHVDEESYDNVWDFVLRGKCTDSQQEGLRCITEGGEGNWIEEQNFPLIHRIIFGLSAKGLAAEIDENPHAIYLTDVQNRTALDWATARVQLEDMALLIKHGADCNNMDVTGRTPVLHAVDSHNINSLRVILEAGGNPNPTYPKGMYRSSPLTAAGFAGMPELLKLLLDFEANPNACNPEGLTALHSVARTHNTECALLLLEYGADLNAMSHNGRTPLTTAIVHNNHPVLQLFVDRCYEYINTARFNAPEILSVVAEYADIETIHILSSAHPLKLSYDVSSDSIATVRALLEKRQDYGQKLADAFDELVTVAEAEADETKSVDSHLEAGFFLSARSTFAEELAGAFSTLDSLGPSPADSDNDDKEEWEDSRQYPQSPTSVTSSPYFRSPNSPARERFPITWSSSPLRWEASR